SKPGLLQGSKPGLFQALKPGLRQDSKHKGQSLLGMIELVEQSYLILDITTIATILFFNHHRSLPEVFIAAFLAVAAFLTMLQPSQQPATYVAAFVAAWSLYCSLLSSVAAFLTMLQPSQQPATYVAAFVAS
ncbi:hypothetical protein Tco_1454526, partial [Tanacetum coccineum]